MNEQKLNELAERAWAYQITVYEDNGVRTYGEREKVFNKQKFAELIVRECAELFVDQKYMILNPHEPFANERVRALKEHDKDTVRKIKQHFGVES